MGAGNEKWKLPRLVPQSGIRECLLSLGKYVNLRFWGLPHNPKTTGVSTIGYNMLVLSGRITGTLGNAGFYSIGVQFNPPFPNGLVNVVWSAADGSQQAREAFIQSCDKTQVTWTSMTAGAAAVELHWTATGW